MDQVKNVILFFLPLAVAALSIYLRGNTFFYSGRYQGSAIVLGILCIYASRFMSNLTRLGIRFSTPQEIPPKFFKVLGWVFLLLSFIPLVL